MSCRSSAASPPSTSFDEFGGMSLPVMIAFTPGSASAADVSIETIRACAYGLRSTTPCSMPGRLTSAPYCARPVTLSTPSWRTGRVPMC
jgi:hypothetical protein